MQVPPSDPASGLQLNVVWPDPKALRALKRSKPGVVIVQQINRGAMAECRNDAELVAKRFGDAYADTVDYVLVDASAGSGIPLKPIEAAAYLIELDRVVHGEAADRTRLSAPGCRLSEDGHRRHERGEDDGGHSGASSKAVTHVDVLQVPGPVHRRTPAGGGSDRRRNVY